MSIAVPAVKRPRGHGHSDLLARALDLRENFTSYDAMYVLLAERLSAALLTGDAALGRATRRHSRIEILPAGG